MRNSNNRVGYCESMNVLVKIECSFLTNNVLLFVRDPKSPMYIELVKYANVSMLTSGHQLITLVYRQLMFNY